MRIFSNIYLTWPQVLHVSQVSRVHPGPWYNYYIYRITSRNPTQITTYSPINLLYYNTEYYCYNRYNRDIESEKQGNICEIVTINNQSPTLSNDIWINIPKASNNNDLIVIKTFHNKYTMSSNSNCINNQLSIIPTLH
jgi:hypothetical protein